MSKNNVDVRVNLMEINWAPMLKQTLTRIGKKCSEEIKSNAPRNTGIYADGWTYKLVETNRTSKNGWIYEIVVYNKGKHASLSHLLELGHRSRAGNTVPPQEHIRPVFNRIKKEYYDDLGQIKINVQAQPI